MIYLKFSARLDRKQTNQEANKLVSSGLVASARAVLWHMWNACKIGWRKENLPLVGPRTGISILEPKIQHFKPMRPEIR